ncbi:hypothetical protein HDU93_004970 [Gonapodya sp. JEL0774]|nr:hypothetical protein HDU93_004970 [Gonapodya sp. JEL0774]
MRGGDAHTRKKVTALALALLSSLALVPPAVGTVVVLPTNDTYVDREAAFGSDIPDEGITGRLLPASLFHPDGATHGCDPIPLYEPEVSALPGPGSISWDSSVAALRDIADRLWSDDTTATALSRPSRILRRRLPVWKRNVLSIFGVSQATLFPSPDDATPAHTSTPPPRTPALRPPAGFIALVERGECPFVDKVRAMQQSGAIAVIVGDNAPGGNLVTMYAPGDNSDILIPSVFVAQWEYRDLRYLSSLAAEQWIREIIDSGSTTGRTGGEGGVSTEPGSATGVVTPHAPQRPPHRPSSRTGQKWGVDLPFDTVSRSTSPPGSSGSDGTFPSVLVPPGLPILILPSTPSIPLLSVLLTVVLAPLLVLGILSGYYVMRREQKRRNDVLTREEVDSLGWTYYVSKAGTQGNHLNRDSVEDDRDSVAEDVPVPSVIANGTTTTHTVAITVDRVEPSAPAGLIPSGSLDSQDLMVVPSSFSSVGTAAIGESGGAGRSDSPVVLPQVSDPPVISSATLPLPIATCNEASSSATMSPRTHPHLPVIRPSRPPTPPSPTSSMSSEDLCAICLDHFSPGDRLRPLPCGHDFHPPCVDQWLIERRRVCPVCKQDAGQGKRRGTRGTAWFGWWPGGVRGGQEGALERGEGQIQAENGTRAWSRLLTEWANEWRNLLFSGGPLVNFQDREESPGETQRLLTGEGGERQETDTNVRQSVHGYVSFPPVIVAEESARPVLATSAAAATAPRIESSVAPGNTNHRFPGLPVWWQSALFVIVFFLAFFGPGLQVIAPVVWLLYALSIFWVRKSIQARIVWELARKREGKQVTGIEQTARMYSTWIPLYLTTFLGTWLCYIGILNVHPPYWQATTYIISLLAAFAFTVFMMFPLSVDAAVYKRIYRAHLSQALTTGGTIPVSSDSILLSLVFALSNAGIWTFYDVIGPLGHQQNPAVSQYAITPLLHLVSLFGLSGITFTISWGAGVLAALLVDSIWVPKVAPSSGSDTSLAKASENSIVGSTNALASVAGGTTLELMHATTAGSGPAHRSHNQPPRSYRPLFAFSMWFLFVMLYGCARMETFNGIFFQIDQETMEDSFPRLHVGCVINNEATSRPNSFTPETWTHDWIFNATETLARRGAQLILWSETAARTIGAADEAQLLNRSITIAKKYNLLLGIAYLADHGLCRKCNETDRVAYGLPAAGLPNPDLDSNKVTLINPDGTIAFTYIKSHPVPAVESNVKGGSQVVQIADVTVPGTTKKMRVTGAICFDLSFDDVPQQAGSAGVDLLLEPSYTWSTIHQFTSEMDTIPSIANGFTNLRCNNGYSQAVGPWGERYFRAYTLVGSTAEAVIPIKPHVNTPYAKWGEMFGWICLALTLVVLFGAMAPVPMLKFLSVPIGKGRYFDLGGGIWKWATGTRI